MTGKQWITAGGLVLALATAGRAAVDEEAIRPMLAATHADSANAQVSRLEPVIALALKAGEAAHPRLKPDGTVRWHGYVNILRGGEYRFSAMLRGRVRLDIAGKEVFAAEAAETTRRDGPAVTLPAGIHELTAEFTRLPGAARLELSWQAPHFRQEPLPYDMLYHLPEKAPPRLAADTRSDRGRFLVEEHSCLACHQPDDGDRLGKGLAQRKGPDLSQVGQRVHVGWLYHWLGDPQKVRPGAVMPRMFGDDEEAQRYAVARYLASLDGPVKTTAKPPDTKQLLTSRAAGQRLFTSVGCIACHTDRQWPLADVHAKTTPEKLAEYLANPLKFDPSGRMPNMLLQTQEALDLARFLCQAPDNGPTFDLPRAPGQAQLVAAFKQVDPRPDELAAFQRLPADAQWLDLGKRVVIDRGCNNCHTIAPGGKPFANTLASANFDDIRKGQTHTAGCLAEDAGKRGPAPQFALDKAASQAIRAFLSEAAVGPGSPAPTYEARVALTRFNCLACHSRDGQGGLTPELTEELRRYEKAENAESVVPPPLTGVGHKLRTPWLRQVLTQAARARPWMGLRMPQFGDAQVGKLPEALAALEGTEPEEKVQQVPVTPTGIAAGRFLVGKNAFGCISCHDIAGNVSGGTRGPDLATMNQRVRYDWYGRWLELAQRMQPGTRMPTVFPDGKSLLPNVLSGDAAAQAEAMWAYLSLGPTLPLPEGLEPPKGLILSVQDRPILLRTFLPDAGSRAIAVGYPGGVAVAFDAVAGRLAYAWSGNYLDAAPVWNGRGGTPAKVLGPKFWTAPAGNPWGVTASSEPPDFTARAKDPAYGSAPPDGKVYEGPRRYQFEGYDANSAGLPTFHYQVDGLEVSERPEPLKSTVATGLARHFAVQMPADRTAWLLVGETAKEPRLLDAAGAVLPLALKPDGLDLPPEMRLLVLPQDGDRVTALSAAAAGARWHLRRTDGKWQALLRLPPPADGNRREYVMDLNVWAPYRDQPEFLRDLTAVK
jgi:mono/diheme cytochrome c family protein